LTSSDNSPPREPTKHPAIPATMPASTEERLLADVTPAISIIALGSLIVALSAAFICTSSSQPCTGVVAFALAAGGLSLGASVSFLACHLQLGADEACIKVLPYLAGALAVWWAFAALVLTSVGPFVTVSNGYIGAWFAAVSAIKATLHASPRARALAEGVHRGYDDVTARNPISLAILVGASTIELVAASIPCAAVPDKCVGWNVFAVAAGAVGLAAAAALAVTRHLPAERVDSRVPVLLALFMSAWWTISTLGLTFVSGGPFSTACNGFFATWAATAAATHLAYDQLARVQAGEGAAAKPQLSDAAGGGSSSTAVATWEEHQQAASTEAVHGTANGREEANRSAHDAA